MGGEGGGVDGPDAAADDDDDDADAGTRLASETELLNHDLMSEDASGGSAGGSFFKQAKSFDM
jgi:hypothetical protein